MVIKDRLYGTSKITDKILVELINSPSVQRLKRIGQFGVPDKYYHFKSFSRFEHSLGVMMLLRLLDASLEEQIAGLLHDVSHASFSHVYDWVLEDHTSIEHHESHQDIRHALFLKNSEIPSILEKYGYEVDQISDYHKFKLLEQEIPNLCADRVDYSLRELSPADAKRILPNLTTFQGQIVCRDQKVAAVFARKFLGLQKSHWASIETMSRYRYLGDVLRLALERNVIAESDFWTDDEALLSKLERSIDSEVVKGLETLQNFETHPKMGVRIFKKLRYIDPYFLRQGTLIRLSSADKEFKKIIDIEKKDHQKGFLI